MAFSAVTLVTVCPAFAFSVHSLSRIAFMGTAAGVYLFVRGFLLLARRRLLTRTPGATIGNVAPGLFEMSGNVTGPDTLSAPITGETCFLYRTIASQPARSRNGPRWEKVAEENRHLPFFLNDPTGQIRVDAESAELDLLQDFCQEFNVSAFSENDVLPREASAFLARNGVTPRGRIRIEEWTVTPGEALFVVGSVMEDSGAVQFAAAAETATVGQAAPDTLKPSAPETIRLSDPNTPATAAEMTQQGKIAAALVKAGMQSSDLWESPAVLNEARAAQSAPLLSQLVINGARKDMAKNEPALKFLLRQGPDNSMFLISWRSRLDVIRSLTWKSCAMIWGGGGLILVGVYVLLQ